MKSDLRVSLLPMTSTENVSQNLDDIQKGLQHSDAEVLFLPENSLYMRVSKGPIPMDHAFHAESDEIVKLQTLCKQKKKTLHLGGIPWRCGDGVMNQSVIIHADGSLDEHYAKTHLFDLELGDLKVQESASFTRGRELKTFRLGDWKMATCICYDLRFPELFLQLNRDNDVDAFIVPAAFTAKTGEAHWEVLLRARAIENQCYVIAIGQVGGHWDAGSTSQRKTWGQSMVINPWGEILAESANYHQYLDSGHFRHEPITSVLAYEPIVKVKQSMPMADHRIFTTELKLR